MIMSKSKFKFHCVFQFYDDRNFFCDVESDDIGHAYILALNKLVNSNYDLTECDYFSVNYIE